MEAFRSIQFDVVIAQDASASRGLVRIDEGNSSCRREPVGHARVAGAYHTSKTAESSGGEVASDGLCARKVNESTGTGDSGSGHPLALPMSKR